MTRKLCQRCGHAEHQTNGGPCQHIEHTYQRLNTKEDTETKENWDYCDCRYLVSDIL